MTVVHPCPHPFNEFFGPPELHHAIQLPRVGNIVRALGRTSICELPKARARKSRANQRLTIEKIKDPATQHHLQSRAAYNCSERRMSTVLEQKSSLKLD